MDLDAIEAGVDFGQAIDEALRSIVVLLAVIGPGWLSSTDVGGNRRLDDPGDFVRLEIKTALQRDIRVIPILVDGAAVPRQEHLPEELAPLGRRNALSVRRESLPADINRLLAALEDIQELSEAAAATQRRNPVVAGQQLGHDWFVQRFKEAEAAAGPRYTPASHVMLPVQADLEGLAINQRFRDALHAHRARCEQVLATAQEGLTRWQRSLNAPSSGGDSDGSALIAAESARPEIVLKFQRAATQTRSALDRIGQVTAASGLSAEISRDLLDASHTVDQVQQSVRTVRDAFENSVQPSSRYTASAAHEGGLKADPASDRQIADGDGGGTEKRRDGRAVDAAGGPTDYGRARETTKDLQAYLHGLGRALDELYELHPPRPTCCWVRRGKARRTCCLRPRGKRWMRGDSR